MSVEDDIRRESWVSVEEADEFLGGKFDWQILSGEEKLQLLVAVHRVWVQRALDKYPAAEKRQKILDELREDNSAGRTTKRELAEFALGFIGYLAEQHSARMIQEKTKRPN